MFSNTTNHNEKKLNMIFHSEIFKGIKNMSSNCITQLSPLFFRMSSYLFSVSPKTYQKIAFFFICTSILYNMYRLIKNNSSLNELKKQNNINNTLIKGYTVSSILSKTKEQKIKSIITSLTSKKLSKLSSKRLIKTLERKGFSLNNRQSLIKFLEIEDKLTKLSNLLGIEKKTMVLSDGSDTETLKKEDRLDEDVANGVYDTYDIREDRPIKEEQYIDTFLRMNQTKQKNALKYMDTTQLKLLMNLLNERNICDRIAVTDTKICRKLLRQHIFTNITTGCGFSSCSTNKSEEESENDEEILDDMEWLPCDLKSIDYIINNAKKKDQYFLEVATQTRKSDKLLENLPLIFKYYYTTKDGVNGYLIKK